MAFRLFRRRAPRWVVPTVVGLSMIGFQIWNGYTWHTRKAATLPEDIQMVKTYTKSSFLSPWTLVVPQVSRFVAVDLASVQRNRNAPGYAMAKIYLFDRYQPPGSGTQIFDCTQARRADLGPTTEFGDNGLPKNAAWSDLDAEDRMLRAVCDKD